MFRFLMSSTSRQSARLTEHGQEIERGLILLVLIECMQGVVLQVLLLEHFDVLLMLLLLHIIS